MGAGYRLSQLARSGELNAGATTELAAITRDLNEAAGRLERLLATLQRIRERVGANGGEDPARSSQGVDPGGSLRRKHGYDDEGRGVNARSQGKGRLQE